MAYRPLAAALLGFAIGVFGFAACGSGEKLPPPSSTTGGQKEGGGGSFLPGSGGGPPPIDAGGLCGNQLHEIISDSPNVYFVLDASGSMGEVLPGSSTTRYERVRKASLDLVKELGPLINVGAAVFPFGASNSDTCATGAEVMPVAPGDVDGSGTTTNAFNHKTNIAPFGGTPTSATLAALQPDVSALPGRTIVLLVTDGGPNCNANASCSASGCQANIEGCTGATCCNPGGNCCAAGQPAGPQGCLDRDATLAALKAYSDADLPVYVIGIPGSEVYSDLLSEMAIAAGTSQIAAPFYFAVNDLDNLTGVLGEIASIAISCIFEVEDPPTEADQTNVYLDGVILPADLENGWRWMDPDLTRIELLGDACKSLKSGKVKSVQIVSGCPTEPPK